METMGCIKRYRNKRRRDIRLQKLQNEYTDNFARYRQQISSERSEGINILTCNHNDDYNILDDNISEVLNNRETNIGGPVLKEKKSRSQVSCREYYCSKLQVRSFSNSILLHAGKLLQQYIVDMYVKIETSRLDYFRMNQTQLRAELYQEIVDSIEIGESRGSKVGRRVVLPSSFIGRPRDMKKRYMDAMSLVQKSQKNVVSPGTYLIAFDWIHLLYYKSWCFKAIRSTQDALKPIFISVGHRVSLASAIKIVKMNCRFRVLEPIRQEHQIYLSQARFFDARLVNFHTFLNIQIFSTT
ncbi:Helitron helicase-like domain containing protein [Abeliophyllum distichum]|uniref:Helitron helicase-like domain containing protein n=1 Tax=Abeliophyllum distichum TaxID=126358 RepID=A0ABD1UQS5_9LAMI